LGGRGDRRGVRKGWWEGKVGREGRRGLKKMEERLE